ncbi:MAG: PD40 domain-containing protein, partial [Planctomycetes bacterium]|nr:PD40 domain-containing protein [Planctomycetota bacterium]
MRFSERTRRLVMRLAWAGLVIAASLLVGLRLGRPLYYTDGASVVAADRLGGGGMVRWNTPEVVAELPGPVQGRIAVLPDGRLVYGRTTDAGTTDLVSFDPQRPAVPPEPVYGLNTAHNELAPAVGADGRLYFASDRPAGRGGYDLWVASPTGLGFAAPLPLLPCNTALDETDPAPHADGSTLVFARIDPADREQRAASLWLVHTDRELDPEPLFTAGRPRAPWRADRDPVWAPGGNALWFVRQQPGAPLQLLRASWLAGSFDEPLRIDAAWGTRDLRAPMPAADGRSLGLWQPRRAAGDVDLWFRSEAEELLPWWPGQRWLEHLLLGTVAVCALLLVLLHLGRRWQAMDLVAQCLLLSLLLHVLLLLWLYGVEVPGSPLPGSDDEGRIEVALVAAASPSTAAAAAPQAADVVARATFAVAPRPLAVEAPAAAVDDAARQRQLATPRAEWQRELQAAPVEAAAGLQDHGAEPERRAAVAEVVPPTAAELPAVQRGAAVAPASALAAAAAAPVVVAMPGAAVAPGTAPRALLTSPTPVAVATARSAEVAPAAVVDAAPVTAVRAAAAGPSAVAPANLQVAAAAAAAPAVARAAVAAAEPAPVAAPTGALARGTAGLAAPAAAPPMAATARELAAVAELRDADAATGAAVTPSAAPTPAPAAVQAAAVAVAAAAATVRGAREAERARPLAAPAAPGTGLERIGVAAPPVAAAPLPTAVRDAPAHGAVALRDPAAAPAAPTPLAAAAPTPAPAPVARAAVPAAAPSASAVAAPARAAAVPRDREAVLPPASALGRAEAREARVGGAPRPLPTARRATAPTERAPALRDVAPVAATGAG